jgi:hypothetical protein
MNLLRRLPASEGVLRRQSGKRGTSRSTDVSLGQVRLSELDAAAAAAAATLKAPDLTKTDQVA